MNKVIRAGLIAIFLSLIFFVGGDEKAQAATADCLDLHAGFCSAAGLHYGINTNINFEAVKTALKKHYNDHSAIFGWSYMEYKGGFWYWVCVNRDIIRFTGVAAPCTPQWGSYGACSASCGTGTQSRTDGCGDSQSQNCTNGPCPSCKTPAHRESYEKTSDVAAGRCAVGTTSDWLDMSQYASNHGKAWTWKCNATNNSVDCVAYKLGECGTGSGVALNNNRWNIKSLFTFNVHAQVVGPPYTRGTACNFGTFNSVHLINAGNVGNEELHWKCGTGESGKYVGSFSDDDTTLGLPVTVDYYGPKTGGVGCKCVPVYEYTCDSTNSFTGNCNNNCGGEILEIYQAYKKDTTCFPDEPRVVINKAEYLTGAGEHCTNKQVQCAPCGAGENNSQGGIYHETVY